MGLPELKNFFWVKNALLVFPKYFNMKFLSILTALFITTSVHAETVILPVQDLLFEVPSFANAPKFGFNDALNGEFVPENPKRSERKSKKEMEKKLIEMMWEEYPDARSIRIWKGNLIIKL
jgi:hypothetical protein